MGDATVMEHLLAATDADLVSFEMDVGWVTAACVSPLDLIAAHPGRFRQAHVKVLLAAPPDTSLDQTPADVGAGLIDWPSLLPELKTNGVAEFYVEREPPFTDDPMAAVKRNHDYVARM